MTSDPSVGSRRSEDACPRCAQLIEQNATLQAQVDDMAAAMEKYEATMSDYDRDFRRFRFRISTLEAELVKKNEDEAKADGLDAAADEVWQFWRTLISPKARAFSEKRKKNVLARLRERDDDESVEARKETLLDAIRGAHVGAYTDPKTGVTYNDLELICRSDEYVVKFVNIWEAHRRREAEKAKQRWDYWRDEWEATERVTLDPDGNPVLATPGPIHEWDTRTPAQRCFDAVILRHVMTVRRIEDPTPKEARLEAEARERIESMNGRERIEA